MKQYQFSLKDECMKEYNHPNAIREEIAVPKEHLPLFEDGKVYNESEFTVGFDCAVYSLGCCSGGNELCDKCHIAIPKQKVDDTDCIEIATDLYKEMQDININSSKGQSILMEYSLLISKLQKHYTITRKNNQ